jgi:hypothetical protein
MCFTLFLGVFAQKFRIIDQKSPKFRIIDQKSYNNEATKLVIEQQNKQHTTNKVSKADTLYFSDVIKCHSWLIGRGDSISHDVAMTLPIYYRFSLKNDKGHWQHIEAMHQNVYASENKLCCYFGSLSDSVPNRDESAYQLVGKAVQWFEYSDFEGENVVEERAYDDDSNLLYSLQYNPISDGRIIASYTDSSGLPIEFSEDANYTYGSVCAITYDKYGYDGLVEYMDAAGYDRTYTNGVYQIKRTYTADGILMEMAFRNAIGNLMNGTSGYSVAKYDYSDNHIIKETHFDKFHNKVK